MRSAGSSRAVDAPIAALCHLAKRRRVKRVAGVAAVVVERRIDLSLRDDRYTNEQQYQSLCEPEMQPARR